MYKVINLDLSAVTAPDTQVIGCEPGKTIAEIVVLDMPVGNQFQLKLGRHNTDYFNVSKSFSMKPTGEDENAEGLYWGNSVPQAAIVVQLIVAFKSALLAIA